MKKSSDQSVIPNF